MISYHDSALPFQIDDFQPATASADRVSFPWHRPYLSRQNDTLRLVFIQQRMNNRSYLRRLLEIALTIAVLIVVQWTFNPLVEYNAIVRRSNDENRRVDKYYEQGR